MSRNAKPRTDADPTYPMRPDQLTGQLAFDDQVPRLDVAAMQQLVGDRVSRLAAAFGSGTRPC